MGNVLNYIFSTFPIWFYNLPFLLIDSYRTTSQNFKLLIKHSHNIQERNIVIQHVLCIQIYRSIKVYVAHECNNLTNNIVENAGPISQTQTINCLESIQATVQSSRSLNKDYLNKDHLKIFSCCETGRLLENETFCQQLTLWSSFDDFYFLQPFVLCVLLPHEFVLNFRILTHGYFIDYLTSE